MARYIDADELYKAAQKRIAEANEARMAVVDDEFLDLINDAFTEDVAPRAELVRDIFRDVRNILNKHYYDCYQYEDGDECDAAITYLSYVAVDFDEIEKKYTEGTA